MQLLLNWKEIIVRDKYITDPAELSKPLSSREDAWNFIIEDLKRATSLPATRDADNVGRATSGSAYAYLGFAYLTRAYEEAANKDSYLASAIEAFNQIKGYELVNNFSTMFSGDNKNSKESIFEIQFSMSSANGATYRTQFHRWIGVSELGGWDEILPSQTLISEFKKKGKRLLQDVMTRVCMQHYFLIVTIITMVTDVSMATTIMTGSTTKNA